MKTLREKIEFNTATSVAIGYFDGVHRGHAAVIGAAVEYAKERGLKSVALTFDMSKRRAEGKGELDLLQFFEKERLISELGVDYLAVLDFSEICDLDGEAFVASVLAKRLHATAVFCGEDFRFSKGKSCGESELRALCAKKGITVTTVDEVADGGAISTTRIKSLIKDGKIDEAARLLGHPLCYTGTVIEGRRLGRRLGFPTANLRYPESITPVRFGVYRTRAYADGRCYEAVSNIGVRPTVDDTKEIFIETYLIGYEGDLYGRIISVEPVRFMRDERRFADENELRAAVLKDIETVKSEALIGRNLAEKI